MFGQTNKPTGLATTFSLGGGGGGLFGSSNTAQPATGGLFGSQQSSNTGFSFGQTQPTQNQASTFSGFGGGGLLGNQTQQQQSSFSFGGSSTLFNKPTSTFGQPSASVGGGLFGGQTSTLGMSVNTVVGTTVKFSPPSGTDSMMKNGISTNVSTKHNCITAMKEYESKSLEELRLEDYVANRKTGTASSFGGGLFGSSSATQNTGGLFGSSVAASTAQSGTGFGLFGSNQPKPGGLFGATSTASGGGLFGGSTQTGSLFGQVNKPATGGLFGSQPQTSSGGLFGGGASGSTFGTGTTGTTGGLFGGSGFGNQGNKGLTLNTATTAPSMFNFGSSATTQSAGGLFGSTQNKPLFGGGTTGGFGTAPAQTGGGLFGNTQQTNTGGLFGNKPLGFGTTTSTAGGGLFGAQPAQNVLGQTGSLFGGLGTANQTSTLGGGGGLFGGATNTGLNLGGQMSAPTQLTTDAATANAQHQMLQQQILALASNPYGDSPLFQNSLIDNKAKKDEITKPINPASQKPYLSPSQHKMESKPVLKVKPNSALKSNRLFDGFDDSNDHKSPKQTFVPRKNPKNLVIKDQPSASSTALPLSMSMNLSDRDPGRSDFMDGNPQALALSFLIGGADLKSASMKETTSSSGLRDKFKDSGTSSVENGNRSLSKGASEDMHTNSPFVPTESTSIELDTPRNQKWTTKHAGIASPANQSGNLNESAGSSHHNSSPGRAEMSQKHTKTFTSPLTNIDSPSSDALNGNSRSLRDSEKENFEGLRRSLVTSPRGTESPGAVLSPKLSKTGVKLHRSEYFTNPDKKTLDEILQKTGKCVVEDFTIARLGYGSVHFPGKTDITDLDLDEIVHIRRKEVTVYPDDEKKPPLGCGLNKRAVITLDKVWPSDKSSHLPITSPQKLALMGYQDKIERSTAKLQAKFIEYRPETGSWVFEVKHFSKYSLADESDDDEILTAPVPAGRNQVQGNQDSTYIVTNPSIRPLNVDSNQPAGLQVSGKGLGGGDLTSKPFIQTIEEVEEDDSHLTVELKSAPNKSPSKTFALPFSSLKSSAVDPMQSSLFAIPEDSPKESKSEHFNQNRLKRKSPLSKSSVSERADFLLQQYRKEKVAKNVKDDLCIPNFEGIDVENAVTDGLDCTELTPRCLPMSMFSSYRVSWNQAKSVISCPLSQSFLQRRQVSLFEGKKANFQVVVSEVFDSECQLDGVFVSKVLNTVLTYSFNDMSYGFPICDIIETPDLVNDLSSLTKEHATLKNTLSLCKALFGKIDRELIRPNPTGDSYEVRQFRREALSDWLTNALKDELENIGEPSKILSCDQAFDQILLFLTCNQRSKAVDVALRSNLPRLALILAQQSTPNLQTFLSILDEEVESMGTAKLLHPSYAKLLKILSGKAATADEDINIFEGFSWKRSFGVCLWFLTYQNSSIKDVLQMYLAQCGEGLMEPPLVSNDSASDVEGNGSLSYLDACFHLMQLFVDPTYKPEYALNPLSFATDITDYFPAWIVMNTLRSLGFVNFDQKTELSVVTNFAWQLERETLWEWSAFVLSFIKADLPRKAAIQDLLDRNCSSCELLTNKETFLIEQLNISVELIHKSKALRASIQGQNELRLNHLLKAGELNKVHEMLIFEGLAADFYFSDSEDKLTSILGKLDSCSFDIENWMSYGGVLFDYFNLKNSAHNLSASTETNTKEVLSGLLDSYLLILGRLSDFPIQTDKMRVLMSEICESVIVSIRILDEESTEIILPKVKSLPLFKDQLIAQLNNMAIDLLKVNSDDDEEQIASH